jgi:hypothetical protein
MPAEGHKSRHAALALFAGAPTLAVLPVAAIAAPHGDDSELLAMEAEIMRLRGLAKAIYDENVEPFEDAFHALMRAADSEAAWAFAHTYGRDDAIDEAETFNLPAHRLCERLMATPARTQAGRAAKVRVLLADILANQWRGPANDLDWDIAQARVLFADLAGMRRNSPRFGVGLSVVLGGPTTSGCPKPKARGGVVGQFE